MVDRIITVGLEFDFLIFSSDCSIDEVSNLFVSISYLVGVSIIAISKLSISEG